MCVGSSHTAMADAHKENYACDEKNGAYTLQDFQAL